MQKSIKINDTRHYTISRFKDLALGTFFEIPSEPDTICVKIINQENEFPYNFFEFTKNEVGFFNPNCRVKILDIDISIKCYYEENEE